MHPYATNSPANPKLFAFLAIAAVASSGAASYLAKRADLGWTVGAPSAMAFFAFFYWIFDQHLWKWNWLRHLLLIPDLNGTWICAGRTTIKNGEDVEILWDAEIRIQQSWSKIKVVLKTSRSTSESDAASLYRSAARGFRLVYHYHNCPDKTEPALHQHFGLADLMFSDDRQIASGSYFTGKDRLTVGEMTLTRKV